MRALPRAFEVWLAVSHDEEILALLDLVRDALERRGYVVAVASRRVPASGVRP